ncbi:hypothetical protein [Rosenbergiella nectarea]|uniref:hypothetical protein n=1 Tax=Rosenbergiella nectarea TaxID=988801 RepID=UPI001F501B91|nr:hypothetical protein [Rosenbergiella nectarea]
MLHVKAQGSFWILGRKLIDGQSLFLPQATQLLENPVDKMGKIGVEKQDLWLTLRYDPRFRKRSLVVYTALFRENIAADVSTLIYIKHIYQYLSAISCLTFCMSGVRRVTYALATVPYPSTG